MQNVESEKSKLAQKKNRLLQEETKLKLKERKLRTKRLIELGGLVTKAALDHLPSNTLYGALLSLSYSLKDNPKISEQWTNLGKTAFEQEQQTKQPVILKFPEEPNAEIRQTIREHGLKWNRFRSEWYGFVSDLNSLKQTLKNIQHNLEIIPN